MNRSSPEKLSEAIRVIVSLIGKSEKAQQKLAAGTGPHAILEGNLRALRVAWALMTGSANGAEVPGEDDLRAALVAFAEMTRRSEQAQVKFAPGTSQHTLLRNRLSAFRSAEARITAALSSRDG